MGSSLFPHSSPSFFRSFTAALKSFPTLSEESFISFQFVIQISGWERSFTKVKGYYLTRGPFLAIQRKVIDFKKRLKSEWYHWTIFTGVNVDLAKVQILTGVDFNLHKHTNLWIFLSLWKSGGHNFEIQTRQGNWMLCVSHPFFWLSFSSWVDSLLVTCHWLDIIQKDLHLFK